MFSSWKVGLTTEKAAIRYVYRQGLTYPVHRPKRFLQLSSPQESDDMIFGGCNGSCMTCPACQSILSVVNILHSNWYECAVNSQPSQPSSPEDSKAGPIPDIFASVSEPGGINLSHCIPGLCLSRCGVHPNGDFSINYLTWVSIQITHGAID